MDGAEKAIQLKPNLALSLFGKKKHERVESWGTLPL